MSLTRCAAELFTLAVSQLGGRGEPGMSLASIIFPDDEVDSPDGDTLPLSGCSWSEVFGGGAPEFERAVSSKKDEMDEDGTSHRLGSRRGRGRRCGWKEWRGGGRGGVRGPGMGLRGELGVPVWLLWWR